MTPTRAILLCQYDFLNHTFQYYCTASMFSQNLINMPTLHNKKHIDKLHTILPSLTHYPIAHIFNTIPTQSILLHDMKYPANTPPCQWRERFSGDWMMKYLTILLTMYGFLNNFLVIETSSSDAHLGWDEMWMMMT